MADENTIFIWSNGHPYSSKKEYGQMISLNEQEFGKPFTNVFINTCIPLAACFSKFVGARNVIVDRECSANNADVGFFGASALKKSTEMGLVDCAWIVSCADAGNFDCLRLDEFPPNLFKEFGGFKGISSYTNVINLWNEVPDFPKDKKNSATTGFIAYLLARKLHPDSRIVLVNFGVRDKRFMRTTKVHDIEFEDMYFNENKVERLWI